MDEVYETVFLFIYLFSPRGMHAPRAIFRNYVLLALIFLKQKFEQKELRIYWTDFYQIFTIW